MSADCFTQCESCHRNSNGERYCKYCETSDVQDDYDRAETYLDIRREREAEDDINDKDEYD